MSQQQSNKKETYVSSLVVIALAYSMSSSIAFIFPSVFRSFEVHFGIGPFQLGVLTLCMWMTASIVSPFWGFAADNYPSSIILSIGMGILAVGVFGVSFSRTFSELAIFVSIVGSGVSCVSPVVQIVVSDLFSARSRGKSFGILGLIGAFASLLTSSVSLQISDKMIFGVAGWKIIFEIFGFICILLSFLSYHFVRTTSFIKNKENSQIENNYLDRKKFGYNNNNDDDENDNNKEDYFRIEKKLKKNKINEKEKEEEKVIIDEEEQKQEGHKEEEREEDEQEQQEEQEQEQEEEEDDEETKGLLSPSKKYFSKKKPSKFKISLSVWFKSLIFILNVKTILLFMLIWSLSSLVLFGGFQFVLLWLQYIGFSIDQTTLLFACFQGGSGLGQWIGGISGDRLYSFYPNSGRLFLAELSYSLSFGLFCLIFWVIPHEIDSFPFVAFALALLGIVNNLSLPGTDLPIISDVVCKDMRASAVATLQACSGVVGAFGASIVGFLAEEVYGYQPSDKNFEDMDQLIKLKNRDALGHAVAVGVLVPWIGNLICYGFCLITYPNDKQSVNILENSRSLIVEKRKSVNRISKTIS